jgi:hypothetical protein
LASFTPGAGSLPDELVDKHRCRPLIVGTAKDMGTVGAASQTLGQILPSLLVRFERAGH